MSEFEKTDEIKVHDDTDKVVNWIESITSYNVLSEIKKLYEDIYQDVSRGEIYYTARKSAYVTKFDITLSDGRKIAEMTMEGDYDTVPKEMHKALLNNYKAQAEKVLSLLDDKIYLAGKMKKESDRKTFWFIIIGAFLFYCCFLLISLGIKYVLRI